MGPVAVLADIHGNLAALEAVLAALKPVHPRAYVVLGDSFGELGQAQPVLDRLRELNAFCLMGNRERDLAAYIRGEKPEWYGAMQFAALAESARALGAEMKDVAGWPMTASWEGLRLAHGTPADVYELMHPGTSRVDELLAAMAEPGHGRPAMTTSSGITAAGIRPFSQLVQWGLPIQGGPARRNT